MRRIGVITAGGDAPGMNAARPRLTVLGYAQRGGSPTARGRILANQLGAHAEELLLKGAKKNMVGTKGQGIVSVDLDYAWKERKDLDMSRYHLAEILSA